MKLCFALFVLAFVNWSLAATTCRQKTKSTKLFSFWGTKINIKIPCKYNAVRQTCGDYLINISPVMITFGNKFRLDAVWFSVGSADRNGTKYWEGRTNNKQAVKFLNGNTTEFLSRKKGTMATSDLFYSTIENEGDVKTAMVTEKSNVFSFTFTPWEPKNKKYKKSWWTFTCYKDITIAPYPQQVCGANKDSGFRSGKKFVTKYGLTADQLFLYDLLTEAGGKITQVDDQCKKAEDIFQNKCPNNEARKHTIRCCAQLLTRKPQRKCITKYTCSPMHAFLYCLEWVCGGCTDNDLCYEVASSTDACRVKFPDGNLTEKIDAAKCYKDYLHIL